MDVFKTLILDTPTAEGGGGTVTSVGLTAGTGISVSGSPITSSGSITVTNTAPDQTVALTGGTGISTSGTYPNFTITNSAPDQTVSIASGTGISVTGTYPSFTVAATGGASGDVVGPASATDNAIARYDSTTGKLIQNSAVTVDDAGGINVGATGYLTIPSYIYHDTDTNTYIGFPTTDAFTVTTNGTEKLRVNFDGDVGIGTGSPSAKLDVVGAAEINGNLTVADNSTLGSSNTDTVTFNARSASEFTPATDDTYDLGRVGHEWRDLFINGTANIDSLVADTADVNGGTIDGATIGATTASSGAFTTLSASDDVNFDSGTLFVDASADSVGIGTTSPDIYSIGSSKLLTVSNSSASGYSYLTLAGGSGGGGEVDFGNQTIRHAAIASVNGSALNFYTNGTDSGASVTERMRIDSSGNVGIGKSPNYKLDVQGVIQAGDGTYGLQAGTGWGGTSTNTYLATNGASTQMVFGINGSEKMRVNSSGNVGIGTTSPAVKLDVLGSGSGAYYGTQTYGPVYYAKEDNTDNVGRSIFNFIRGSTTVGEIATTNTTCSYNNVSDYRLKEITGPVVDSGKFIDGLKPKVGTWKLDGSKFVGFLAHEFAEISPSSVRGEKDAVDADGNPVYQSMQASTPEVMANLIAELQSLRARVAELEAKA